MAHQQRQPMPAMPTIKRAVASASPVIMLVAGSWGAGKTRTAIETGLALSGSVDHILLCDLENGRGDRHAKRFGEYHHTVLPSFHPSYLREFLFRVVRPWIGTDRTKTVIFDGLSPVWEEVLLWADDESIRMDLKSEKDMRKWIAPKGAHKAFLYALLDLPCNLIATCRMGDKVDFSADAKAKDKPKGIVRPDIADVKFETDKDFPYIFDVVLGMTKHGADHHHAWVLKSVYDELEPLHAKNPGQEFALQLAAPFRAGADNPEYRAYTAPAETGVRRAIEAEEPTPDPQRPTARIVTARTCDKVCHPTRDRAEVEAVKMETKNADGQKVAAYYCEEHQAWHCGRSREIDGTPTTADGDVMKSGLALSVIFGMYKIPFEGRLERWHRFAARMCELAGVITLTEAAWTEEQYKAAIKRIDEEIPEIRLMLADEAKNLQQLNKGRPMEKWSAIGDDDARDLLESIYLKLEELGRITPPETTGEGETIEDVDLEDPSIDEDALLAEATAAGTPDPTPTPEPPAPPTTAKATATKKPKPATTPKS